MTRLVLHAPNVHTGGGLVLLRDLLGVPGLPLAFANLDARALPALAPPPQAVVNVVRPHALDRLRAEFALARNVRAGDLVLCFHGLPPLRALAGRVVVFLQNRNYLGLNPLSMFGPRTRLRLAFERFVARAFRDRVDEYIVQTPSMARATRAWHGGAPSIRVLPFMDPVVPPAAGRGAGAAGHDFIYVADGEAHKNHRTLLSAWVLLAEAGARPSLALTLEDRFGTLLGEIAQARSTHGLRIENLGVLTRAQLLEAYAGSRALVFPSDSESFGLPLLEAAALGLPIVAAERDFVRDVCEPAQTFDPASPTSIARAVRRFLDMPEPRVRPRSGAEFIAELMSPAATTG